MSESAQPETEPAAAPGAAAAQALAALRQAGADRFDPVRLHYLEALSARIPLQEGRVQALLQSRLDAALAALQCRLEQARSASPETRGSSPMPAAPLARTPLAELTQYLAQHAHAAEPELGMAAGLRPDLKAVRQFRNTWSKLSAGKQLTRALDQAPKNAGPINSHMLVLRSLALMRDIAPDYLNRFMSYADALLCLDQPLKEPSAASKPTEGTAAKKARSPRTKPRPPKIPE